MKAGDEVSGATEAMATLDGNVSIAESRSCMQVSDGNCRAWDDGRKRWRPYWTVAAHWCMGKR